MTYLIVLKGKKKKTLKEVVFKSSWYLIGKKKSRQKMTKFWASD